MWASHGCPIPYNFHGIVVANGSAGSAIISISFSLPLSILPSSWTRHPHHRCRQMFHWGLGRIQWHWKGQKRRPELWRRRRVTRMQLSFPMLKGRFTVTYIRHWDNYKYWTQKVKLTQYFPNKFLSLKFLFRSHLPGGLSSSSSLFCYCFVFISLAPWIISFP